MVDMSLTWKDVTFNYILPDQKKDRIIGLSFPENDLNLGLEPSILTVLPDGDNVEYSLKNIDFPDDDVRYYLCSVYIAGMDEFKAWANRHDKTKIIVGGYHPTTFPEEFKRYAAKIVVGPCDDIYATIAQSGQIVHGVTSYNHLPRYDLYDVRWNQQVIPDKLKEELCTSISTSQGCPFRCDFCCTPIMSNKLISKPLDLVTREIKFLHETYAKYGDLKYIFIRDENFPLQKDWKERLAAISAELPKVKIYLFASANTLDVESIKYMAKHNVYMICLGLENINKEYKKNENLDNVIKLLKIYTYLSFIVDPLEIIGQEKGKEFYELLLTRLYTLKPEMICGNFLMPFRGTKLWDKYYAYISEDDYKFYNSKSAFMIRNKVVRAKMEFFMWYYQMVYYNSSVYKHEVRNFNVDDTLAQRFDELKKMFTDRYNILWNKRG